MAIVKMKHVSLLAACADKEALLHILQRAECVEITERGSELSAYQPKDQAALHQTDELLTRIRWAISRLSRHANEKTGMLQSMSMPMATEEETLIVMRDKERLMDVVSQIERYEKMIGEIRGNETRIKARIDQLLPWRTLDIPIERIRTTRETVQYVGWVASGSLPALREALVKLSAKLSHIGDKRELSYVWIVCHRADQETVSGALKDAEFTSMQFADEQGTPAEMVDTLYAQLQEFVTQRTTIDHAQKELAKDYRLLKILYEIIAQDVARARFAEQLAETRSTFLLEGWVPEYTLEKLTKKLKAAAPDCVLESRDPAEDELPPTALRNSKYISPYEAVVLNYSWPSPYGLDPTFMMAPFFLCFFGMMVSDAGYGLVMAILIPLIIHFAKPKTGLKKIMWILAIGGISTIFWGAMFDTWFGTSVKPMLINTLEQPLEMMILCLGFGILHLFTGLGIGAYVNIKRKDPLAAVFDQLSWFLLIVGLGLLLLPQTAGIGKVFSILGAVIIVLTAGRAKENWVKRIVGGFGALYGATGWISDLLSYMRLFGMGLATGVIGMVINLLVGLMLGKNIFATIIGVVILVGGHILNAAINIMGAYVHSCRLQYIEFFSKFFDDGGRPFRPLKQNPRYIAINDTDPDCVTK